MKYAVISDIHGNYPALKAVLEDAKKQEISQFLFVGDYCISGPWPDKCIAEIKSIKEKHVIRGNEEKYLEDLVGKDQSLWLDGQMQISYWCYKNMSFDHLEYLFSLPHKDEFECNGIKIHMAHSSMDFLGTYPFYTWNSVTVAERNRHSNSIPESILSDMEKEREQDSSFQEIRNNLQSAIYVFGHSHVHCSHIDRDKGIYLINPGSCGLPLDGIKDSIPYTILEISDKGQVSFEEKRVPFNKEGYINEVMLTSQFNEANVWSRVIFREQITALEHMYFFLAFVKQYAEDIGDDIRPYSIETWERAFELWNRKQED